MALRKEQFLGNAQSRPSVYSKHIFCAECGAMCRRKVTNGKIYWVCHKHDQAKSRCPVPQVPEAEITAAVLRLHGKLAENRSKVLLPMLNRLRELRERELRSNKKISDIDHELARLSEQNLVLVRLKSKGYVDSALYLSQQDEIICRQKDLRKLRRNILDANEEDQQLQTTEMMVDYLAGDSSQREDVDDELFESLIDRIQIVSAEQVKIRLLNGLELSEHMERAVR